jgi:putative membrane protein
LRLRAIVIIGALAGHAILSKLLYAHASSLANNGTSANQWRQGAQILWYGGDAVDLLLLVAYFARWYSIAGRREARRLACSTREGALGRPRRSR